MSAQPFHHRLAALYAGEIVNKAAIAAAFIWLARTLSPTAYGDAEWALSVTLVFILLADAGLSTWAVAEVAARPSDASSLVARVARLRLSLAIPAYALLLIAAWIRGGPAGQALVVYGLALFLTPLFLQYLFDGLLQSKWTALVNALRGVTFLLSVIWLVRSTSSPTTVGVAEVLGAAALAAASLAIARRLLPGHESPRAGFHDLRALFKRSWSVGASELTWGVHTYGGLILLGYFTMPEETAWHSANLRLLLAIHTAVWLYLSTLLPTLARVVRTDPDAWRRVIARSLRITTLAGLSIAIVGTFAAAPILGLVFGEPFVAGSSGFRVLIWVIPVAWISGHIRYSLIAAEHPAKEFHARLAGAIATIVLTLVLVPSLRSTGAAMALLGGTIVNTLAAWTLAQGALPTLTRPEPLART